MDKEIFKPLVYNDIKDIYEISNYGTIRNKDTYKILKPFLDKDGYERINLMTETGSRKVHVHRLVAFNYISGHSDERNIVNHKDSQIRNNYYGNLEWVTNKENTHHGKIHGNIKRHDPFIYSQRKYDEELIHKICSYLQLGLSTKQILRVIEYPKNMRRTYKTLIVDIRSGRSWLHVSKQYKINKV
jgi:hypothetical protein